jgi:hypothetical protein
MNDAGPKKLRPVFYAGIALVSLAATFALIYFLVLYITVSYELAILLVVFGAIFLSPFLFVVLYWTYRLEFRPHAITEDELSHTNRSSQIMALASLPYFFGIFAWRDGLVLISIVALSFYAALTIYGVNSLWRFNRTQYERLIAEGLLRSERQRLTPKQRSSLIWVCIVGFIVSVLVWTGIYFMWRGSNFLGLSLASLGAVLCHPMIRKLRQVVLEEPIS